MEVLKKVKALLLVVTFFAAILPVSVSVGNPPENTEIQVYLVKEDGTFTAQLSEFCSCMGYSHR
jgi:hypothetical protein